MKIVRFTDFQGTVHYGRLTAADDYSQAEILKGTPMGGFETTSETVGIESLLAPILPPNLLCIGLNYRKHAEESGMAYPERPLLFIKATTTITDPNSDVVIPDMSTEVDYEAELGIVIGKTARDVSEADALDYVFGYVCANDVTARDWQFRFDKQWARGKSFDGFCPLGPVLVTVDEIPDPNKLGIRMHLNNQMVQNSSTADMIFDVREIVSYLSQGMTLLPGTLILTGTPEGVGMGKKPQVWLKPGDVTTVEIDGLGSLTNTFVAPE